MNSRKTKLYAMDDATADWYDYHFNDTLLLHDTGWRFWRLKLQELLNQDQLEGRRCAICNRTVHNPTMQQKEFLGGYTIVTCTVPCNFSELSIAKIKRSLKIKCR